VYIADSIVYPGGLVDRLKGIISLYDYVKENNIPFYVHLSEKYNFIPFLKFNNIDIYLNELDRDINTSKIFYFMDNVSIQNYNGYFSYNKINHVYTNIDLLKYKYANDSVRKWRLLFNELFIPTQYIQDKVDDIIKSRKFIVFSFRFRSRMGDFVDDDLPWDEETKLNEINLLNRAIVKFTLDYKDFNIYVATDSSTFLQQLIASNPGQYLHNPNINADMNNYELSIIEFLVISKAQKVFQFKRPTMYSGAFSRYASYVGNIKYELVEV